MPVDMEGTMQTRPRGWQSLGHAGLPLPFSASGWPVLLAARVPIPQPASLTGLGPFWPPSPSMPTCLPNLRALHLGCVFSLLGGTFLGLRVRCEAPVRFRVQGHTLRPPGTGHTPGASLWPRGRGPASTQPQAHIPECRPAGCPRRQATILSSANRVRGGTVGRGVPGRLGLSLLGLRSLLPHPRPPSGFHLGSRGWTGIQGHRPNGNLGWEPARNTPQTWVGPAAGGGCSQQLSQAVVLAGSVHRQRQRPENPNAPHKYPHRLPTRSSGRSLNPTSPETPGTGPRPRRTHKREAL